jgi:hypothetical protein
VTTGCICPGCGGLTPQRGEPCHGCEIAAMPPGVGKAVLTVAYRLLYGGPDVQAGVVFVPCEAAACGLEAGW